MKIIWGILIASSLALPSVALADAELTGFVAAEGRAFFHAPSLANQPQSNHISLVAEPELYHATADNTHSFTAKFFGRYDPVDDARTHADIRQLDWLYVQDSWELRTGISKEFWGVTESNHLVDIINQTDFLEDADGEDKLGQPMVQLGLFEEWGTVRAYYLPYFRERQFATLNSRPGNAIAIEDDSPIFESSLEQWHPDMALRYSHTLGDWDIGLNHFYGTSREARFVGGTNSDGAVILRPAYDIINQTSTDIQYTMEGWLWKFEGMIRSGHDRNIAAFTGGVEYTFYGIFDSDLDLGTLLEYQFDDRSTAAPVTFANNDSFVGMRLTFNDTQDTELLAGSVIDHDSQNIVSVVEASRRIGANWKIEADLRLYNNISTTEPAAFLARDDHFQLRLARYF